MIRFGAWSTLLAVLTVQTVILAALVARARSNRLANRYLAILLVVIAGMIVPFAIGYAGFYDAYPWLTAAPFAIPLAVGPLLFAHVTALARGGPLAIVHFAPAALQFAYQAMLFPFPVATKSWWDATVHQPLLSPLLSLAVLISMTAYATACWRLLRRYETWLAERRRNLRPARRIRLAAALLALVLVARACVELFDLLVRRVDYFDLFGFYVLLAVIAVLLGADGWRNAGAAAPPIAGAPERDWDAQGAAWLERLRTAGWWRDPALDLATLARLLATNTTHLSHALGGRFGGFAGALSAIRADAVAEAIDAGERDDLIALAFAAGFGSKASFNRAFRARFGVSPTEYRARRRLIA